jgi:hypothetical protein
MTAERKPIATIVVGTPAATASKDADTTRDETVIYGRTSLTRMPVSASIDASMIELHTKTCAASSMMQLTPPWPKTVLLTSPTSSLAAQFQAREA